MPRDGTKRANARNTSTPASLRSRNIDQGIPTEGIPDDLSFLEVAATSPHHVLIFAIAFFLAAIGPQASASSGTVTPEPESVRSSGSRSREGGSETKDERRMWDFLLYSLGNALDTVYYECELQSSSSKCEHVLALLAAFSQDFETLCDRLQRQEDFEVSLEEGNYASIAWEVRTASRLRSVHVDTSDDEKEEVLPDFESLKETCDDDVVVKPAWCPVSHVGTHALRPRKHAPPSPPATKKFSSFSARAHTHVAIGRVCGTAGATS
jgi:hypothetical protein